MQLLTGASDKRYFFTAEHAETAENMEKNLCVLCVLGGERVYRSHTVAARINPTEPRASAGGGVHRSLTVAARILRRIARNDISTWHMGDHTSRQKTACGSRIWAGITMRCIQDAKSPAGPPNVHQY
jgi:hypothetical protein